MDNNPKPKLETSARENTFSSQLANENILSERNFSGTPASTGPQAPVSHRSFHRFSLWQILAGLAVVALAAILLFWLYSRLAKKVHNPNVDSVYGVTNLDVSGLQANANPDQIHKLVFNGDTIINGTVNATSYSGNGTNLTNINADNITLGTLNDARLSSNVALLDATQTFTGNNTLTGSSLFSGQSTFSGQVSLPDSVSFGGQLYAFPGGQALGFLTNDGSGNLSWTNPSGGCITCFTDGGNSFGHNAILGTNDAFSLIFRSGGANRLTIDPSGSSTFGGAVNANSFSGNGAGLTNLNASQINSGTLSNARLSGSVTVQGNVFNGISELIQLDGLGHLPAVNGGNLTSLNASNVTSGTLADARLTANVALLNANQTFAGANAFTQAVTVNTLTPTAAMTIGATNRSLALQGTNASSWTATQAGGTTTVNFTGVATGGVTYQFDAAAVPGTYTICTTAGGACGGGGSGNVSTPGGTTNKLAKFTAAQTIADSSITDTGAAVSIGASELRVNGAAGGYTIDATGDINAGVHLRVGGNIVCDSTGCNASGGGGFYIQNSTSQQSAANFFIQSVGGGTPTGVMKDIGGQTADLLQLQNSGGSTIADIYAGGGFNTTDKYYVSGVQIASSNLSDGGNLAKLNANQIFTGTNTFANTVTIQNAADSTHELQVLNAAGSNTVLNVDSLNGQVSINQATGSWPLDVVGDINSSTGLRVGGVLVCDITGCTSSGGGGGIQNGTTVQTNANFYIQSASINAVTAVVEGKSGQVADLFHANNDAGTPVFKIGNTGLVTLSNGVTFAGGNQTIQNNTGALNLTASSTTISLNPTTTITSGDGTGLRYAVDYAYQPLSLVSRQYVDNAISSVIVGACPTCFLNGGNSFGISASLGTNDNNTLALKTANTQRILLGTNGGIAMQGSVASGNYSTATGSATASGDYSFATGYNNAPGLTAAGQGSFAGGYALSFAIAANAPGSMAFGMTRYGPVTVNASAEGAFAGGTDSAVGASGIYSIAYGDGTRANGAYSAAFNNSTASGSGAFSIGTSTASGQNSFSSGYFLSFGITSSGLGSAAFGVGRSGVITSSGEGSLAGGNDSTATAQNAIAFGNGTHATGPWSAAFNNSTASGTGAFASGGGATASGQYSFATGDNNGAGITASNIGSFAGGYALSYAITAGGPGSMAFGMARNGAITTNNAEGSFAGGDNSSVGTNAHYSIAFGTGTHANGTYSAAFNNSTASGTGAFSTGDAVASGTLSFATGYNTGAGSISATNNGAFAGGYAINNLSITAGGAGSMAFGVSRNGSITTNNAEGSFAGGDSSSVGNGANYSIAFGTGTQANGAYSAAFNNSIASGTGSFATGSGTSSGIESFAGGYANGHPITASGDGAIAYGRTVGFDITAAGAGSVAFGYSVDGAITATGRGSFAGGDGATTSAGGTYAISFGANTQANGNYSAAFNNSIASNDGAFSIGAATASGILSFAGGESGSQAYARRSFVFGTNTKANQSSGEGAFSLGRDTVANGNYSFALGYGATASNQAAFAIGQGTASGAYSFAGYNSTASTDGAFAFGNANTASGAYATTFGENNTASGRGALALGQNMSVSGNYSAGLDLFPSAASITENQTFAIMNGYVGINTVTPNSTYASAFALVGTGYSYGSTTVSTGIASRVRAGDNSSGTLVQFERADATVVGSITHNGSNTAYNVASDARLKHDITDTSLGLDTVLKLQVHDFVYNNDSTNTVTTGFIAQELQKLYPEAVSVMDPATGYLGVDYGKLSPLLAKGIQDLNTKVDNLQKQVDVLKSASTTTSPTSVDVVAELAKANAVTLNGDLTVNGKLILAGNIELKGDNSGVIKVPAGQTRVHLGFTKPFNVAPNVTLTAKGLTKASYAVDNEATTGFDVILDQVQDQDTLLNYHAL